MYRCERWESAKEKLQHYRRRQPETTELYRCVYHGRERLPLVWEERFRSTYGVLRDEVLETFDAYLNCGLLAHGAARVYCDTCKHSLLVAFSCRKRGVCPSCGAKRAVKFAEHLYEQVVKNTPSRHVVFTMPKRLRVFFRYDRALNDILFRAAWSSLSEVLGTEAGIPAAVLTVQTAGENLRFHPHLHGCMADGLFAPDGTFMPFQEINQGKLTERFGERVLSQLHKRELITDEVASQILSQEHTGFSVWLGEPFQDKDSKRFVARYIERGPVALDKLSIQDDIVIYTTSDGRAHEFDLLEFLAQLSCHIAKPYESLTRYYGHWSCRARGERRRREGRSDAPPQDNEELSIPAASSSWAACMKRILEIDPLECPRCKGTMRIVAFIQDTTEVKKVMDSLGIAGFSPPAPMGRGPPGDEEVFGLEHSDDL